MPPPVLHMSLAKTLADALALRDVDADRGAYYLGATAPDIRAITRWDRERTHFFNLDNFDPGQRQDDVRGLPELSQRAKVTRAASFLAGYITHPCWTRLIAEVYRPLFGEH
jgi:hypothetical protein